MSKNGQLKRTMAECERETVAYEQKRERSQAAIIRAMLAGTKPSAENAKYFNVFSNLIDEARERLRHLYAELKASKREIKSIG